MGIPVREGFKTLEEGNYTFYIYDVEYDEDFGKLRIKYVTREGDTCIEFLTIKSSTSDDGWNDFALRKLGATIRAALGDDVEEVDDPHELIGHYINADVEHNIVDSKDRPGKTNTFINLNNKESADGFDGEPSDKCLAIIKKADSKNVDLGDLLDD